jgi:hypothetical protein
MHAWAKGLACYFMSFAWCNTPPTSELTLWLPLMAKSPALNTITSAHRFLAKKRGAASSTRVGHLLHCPAMRFLR